MKAKRTLALLALLMSSANLHAEMKVNGFFTAGLTKTNEDKATFLGANDKVRFDPDSVIGMQFSFPVNDETTLTTQMIAHGRDDFKPEMEWAYLTYKASDDLDLRAGRLRIPFFMISDFLEVGYAYPWVRPPIDVYGQLAFSRYDGLNLIYRTDFGDIESNFQAYFGSTNPQQELMGEVGELDVTSLWGFNASFAYESFIFRIGHTEGDYTLSGITALNSFLTNLINNGLNDIADRFGVTDKHGRFSGAGFSYDNGSLIVKSEFTQRSTDGLIADTEGWYLMGAYRFGAFTPHITFSELTTKEDYSDAEAILGPPNPGGEQFLGMTTMLRDDQSSITLGIDYRVKRNLMAKAEYQRIDIDDNSDGLLENATTRVDQLNVFTLAIESVF